MLDHLPASQQRDEDRKSVARRQTNRSHACEAVECGRRPEVYQSQETVNDGGEDESPERNIEFAVRRTEPSTPRNSPVASEGICAATGRCESTYAGEEENPKKQEEQTKPTARGASRLLENLADGLSTGDFEEHLNIWHGEEHGNEVDNASDTRGSH